MDELTLGSPPPDGSQMLDESTSPAPTSPGDTISTTTSSTAISGATLVTRTEIEAFQELDAFKDDYDLCVQVIHHVLSDLARKRKEAGDSHTDQHQGLFKDIVRKIIIFCERELRLAKLEPTYTCMTYDEHCQVQEELKKKVEERIAEFNTLLGLHGPSPNYFIPEDDLLGHMERLYEKDVEADDTLSITQTCQICLGKCYTFATMQCDGLDHLTSCRDCLKRLFEGAMKEYSYPPTCCYGGICYRMDQVECFFDDEFVERFRMKEEEFKIAGKDRVYCSWSGCASFIPPQRVDPDGTATCEKCKRITCSKCKKMAHSLSETCPGAPDAEEIIGLEALVQRQGWKKCPTCETLIEKEEGCSHMTYVWSTSNLKSY